MSFWRDVFGPSRDEVWKQFAFEMGAEFVPGKFLGTSKVIERFGQWTITLDTYVVSSGKSSATYTRVQAPFLRQDGFTLTVYRKTIFSELGRWLGMQDIPLGYPEFDDNFIVKSDDEYQVRQLLADPEIRGLMLGQRAMYFQIQTSSQWWSNRLPEGVSQLYFRELGTIKDIERLQVLFGLFEKTLVQLSQLGLTYGEVSQAEWGLETYHLPT